MKNAIIYTVIFAAIQVVVSFGVQGAYILIYGSDARIDAMGMIITMALFSVAVMALFLLTRCHATGCARALGLYSSGV